MKRKGPRVGEAGSQVEYRLTVKGLPASERPRERLLGQGATALSNAELLAIVLRTGTTTEMVTEMATNLLAQYRGLSGLARASVSELCRYPGVGEAKVAQLLAALELGRRRLQENPEERPAVRSPRDVADLLISEMQDLPQEQLRVVLLDNKNRVVAAPTVYQGNVSGAVVRMAEVFREAVRHNCPSLILVHNHPSGDPAPSEVDLRLTEQALVAGKQLDIEVLDHIVVGRGTFVSLRERGLVGGWKGGGR